ncbi:ribonuclease [Butyrivibrio sp. CB08]|nr:ribonuclease [Butyrivibrio sp. CB08]
MALVLSSVGCDKKPAAKPDGGATEASSAEIIASIPATEASEAGTAATIDLAQFASSSDADTQATDTQTGSETANNASAVASEEALLDEDGIYTTKEDVALYIHTYGKLPQNFMTKKAAKKLGWSGGSLESFAPGMCIGGDYFGNYEGILPEDKEYHECDIDTLGKKSRGAKRIIYSDDGYIYYTKDHYESFELLYEP